MTLHDLVAIAAVTGALLLLRAPVTRLMRTLLQRDQAQPELHLGARSSERPEDELLAEIHDVLWPREEWRAMELDGCPHPQLNGYPAEEDARAADSRPYAVPRRCTCGQWHVYLRRRRHWRTSLARRGRRQ
ncbi:hypothetical protein [Nonomuraea sp. NPDC049758]|uniref:hypothetical protein n=1 Tax=Nonomuraea sp. NPDC049758 TaxID=3154360 RepID=UPI003421EBE6